MKIADRVDEVRERIALACQSSGRDPSEVTLIAVTKGRTAEEVQQALSAGITDIGENYWQEAFPKVAELRGHATLHFLGRLQSNKLHKIAATFDWVHTLASEKARDALLTLETRPSLLVQVNISEEPQKGGVPPNEVRAFATSCADASLRVLGLMALGAANLTAEQQRPYFQRMRSLLVGLGIPGATCLSMGMSNDFEVAIQEGATHIRIGTLLFGERPEAK